METVTPAAPALVRAIGLRALTASIFNMIVGAGIFVLPGESRCPGWTVDPARLRRLRTCHDFDHELLRHGRQPGVAFRRTVCVHRVRFGPATGFVAGFVFWSSNILSAAALAGALAPALSAWIGRFQEPVWRRGFVALLLATLAAVNIRGTRQGTGLIELSTLAKLLPLGVLIAVGLLRMKPENLAHPQLSLSSGFGSAALLLFFAFSGGEMALQASGEVRDANRTVPRALLIAGGSVTLFYLTLQLVVQGVFGNDLASHSESVLADAAGELMGPLGRTLMTAGLILSVFGWLSGDMLNSPRTLYAFAADGFIPRQLAWVHPRFRTPALAIATHAVLVTALASSARFERLANLSSLMLLLVYLLGCMAAWTLDRREVRTVGEPFRPPGALILPWCAATAVIWFMAQSSRAECLLTACVLALGIALYLIRRMKHDIPSAQELRGRDPR